MQTEVDARMDAEILRIDNETEEQMLWRLGQAKDAGLIDIEWSEIGDIINREFRADETEYRSESAYRKLYQSAKKFFEAGVFKDIIGEKYIEQIKESRRELEKEKVKVRTEKLEYNRMIREEARDEMIAERIIEEVRKLPAISFPEKDLSEYSIEDSSYVLAFGDEHYGTEFEIYGLNGEVINAYSPEIFEERMQDLLRHTLRIIEENNIKVLSVYSLGDFSDGVIRVGQLMKLRYGVIEGAVRYANYIANWLNELSKHVYVKYQMVYGNHTELRMLGQPKGTFENENTGMFVKEIIKIRLEGNKNFEMKSNPTGLIFDTVNGLNVLGVHGECGDLSTAIKDFSTAYNKNIHILIGGHLHHYSGETVGIEKDVVSVPSIIGVDSFSMKLRKTSRPGALMLRIDSKDGITKEYRIKL